MYVNIKYCVLANYKAPKTLCNFYVCDYYFLDKYPAYNNIVCVLLYLQVLFLFSTFSLLKVG